MKVARHNADQVRSILAQMDENAAWDHLQARDIDPQIIDYVAKLLTKGIPPGTIAQRYLGFTGKGDRRWKKIQAYFRQGFRADAEAYLFNQTQRLFRMIDKAEKVLDDAFENGTPAVIQIKDEKGRTMDHQVIRVKGATKELGSFLESYARTLALPVRLWKEYGAIGDKNTIANAGTTIVVQNNIPMPSPQEILAHQQEMEAKSKAIEVKVEEYARSES